MNAPQAAAGPIAYASTLMRIQEETGLARIYVTGCIVNSDGTLARVGDTQSYMFDVAVQIRYGLARVGDTQSYMFDVAVQIRYGMSTSELVTDVENALAASWGVTGLADVKFTPSF
jgi:hypothetical protein